MEVKVSVVHPAEYQKPKSNLLVTSPHPPPIVGNFDEEFSLPYRLPFLTPLQRYVFPFTSFPLFAKDAINLRWHWHASQSQFLLGPFCVRLSFFSGVSVGFIIDFFLQSRIENPASQVHSVSRWKTCILRFLHFTRNPDFTFYCLNVRNLGINFPFKVKLVSVNFFWFRSITLKIIPNQFGIF